MFEKRDYRVIRGAKIDDVWARSWDWWQRAGFALYHVGPGHITGASYFANIGLRREVELRFQEANDVLHVDICVRARITNEGAVAGTVAAVLFWPVAVVGGAVSWSEYENDANALISSFWSLLSQVTGKPSEFPQPAPPPPVTPYVTTPSGSVAPARTCLRCGTGLAPGWRACPNCGQFVT